MPAKFLYKLGAQSLEDNRDYVRVTVVEQRVGYLVVDRVQVGEDLIAFILVKKPVFL